MSPSGRENDQGWFLVRASWANNTELALARTGQLGNKIMRAVNSSSTESTFFVPNTNEILTAMERSIV